MVDELLVELHLLSHQKKFQQNLLFSIGIKEVFSRFTIGYKPTEHLPLLFDSLCKSSGFEPSKIKVQASKHTTHESAKNIDDLKILLVDSNNHSQANTYYCRLMAVGVYELVMKTQTTENKDEALKESIVISKSIGLPVERVEKDLKVYSSNIERISQAIELIRETSLTEKKKKEGSNPKKEEDSPLKGDK